MRVRFAQLCDRVEIDAAAERPIDHSALLGVWVNSNPETKGIARLAIAEVDGKPKLEVQAIGPDSLINWGATDITVFASSPSSRKGVGFTCRYDFGFAETRLQGMILKGLAVLSQFHIFKDDSQRVDYFVREYFALEHGLY